MKKIIALLLGCFLTSLGLPAQQKIFLRVYDKNDRKFAKGYFAGATDSSLLITNSGSVKEISVSRIGNIKTKRAPGNDIATGAVIGIIPGSILGALSSSDIIDKSDNYSMGQGIMGGAMIGAATLALAGVIVASLKDKEVYLVANRTEQWLQVKPLLDKLPVYKNAVKKNR